MGRAGTALVVDDSPEIVALLVPLLEREGFTVSSATDGEHAVEVARAIDPDLIILDLALPRLDGTEVCRRIRAFSDAYLIMLTARAEEIDLLAGLAIGADDYLRKPFSPQELRARVQAVLARRAAA
jgi:DNA-binding response OmpR family regulator